MTQLPDGTDVCYYGYIQAKIGGWNGADHLIVEREDDGPDVWSSNFVEGYCEDDVYIDPCYGIVCDNGCFGNDLYSTTCDNGMCVQSELIEENSYTCVDTVEDDWYKMLEENAGYILLVVVAGIAATTMIDK